MENSIYQQFYELEKDHWWFRGMYAMFRDEAIRRIFKADNPDRVILDIGCGTGCWTEGLLPYGNVIAIDKADEALAICRRRGLRHLIRGDAETLPVTGSSCDVITSLGLVEHLANDFNFFKEIQRVLKPGGYGLLLTSAYMFLWGQHDDLVHHKRRYTKNIIKKMSGKAGLDIIKISYINFFLFLPILIVRVFTCRRSTSRCRDTVSPDLSRPIRPINVLFYGLLRFESWILRWAGLPFGVSLFVLVRKKTTGERMAAAK